MGSRRAEAQSDGRESRATGDAPVRPVVPSVGLYLGRPCTRMVTPCWRVTSRVLCRGVLCRGLCQGCQGSEGVLRVIAGCELGSSKRRNSSSASRSLGRVLASVRGRAPGSNVNAASPIRPGSLALCARHRNRPAIMPRAGQQPHEVPDVDRDIRQLGHDGTISDTGGARAGGWHQPDPVPQSPRA